MECCGPLGSSVGAVMPAPAGVTSLPSFAFDDPILSQVHVSDFATPSIEFTLTGGRMTREVLQQDNKLS